MNDLEELRGTGWRQHPLCYVYDINGLGPTGGYYSRRLNSVG